jgi:hypothetical protein
VRRMGAALVAMELAALTVAVLAFGWPVLLVGAPLVVGSVIVLAVVRLCEAVRQRRERRMISRWGPATTPRGLMTGFFEVASVPDQPPMPAVDVPLLRAARRWGRERLAASAAAAIRSGCRLARGLEMPAEWPRRDR